MELDLDTLQMLPADEAGLAVSTCTMTCSNGWTCTWTGMTVSE